MSTEWANRFNQFALAVDYMDDNIVDEVKELLQRYFQETLKTCYFRFLMEGAGTETPDGILPTLETVWSSNEEKTGDVALFASDRRASGHIALCYQQRKPLWITAKHGKLLVDAGADVIDSWSRPRDLPPYRDYGDSKARTSIIVPLRYGEHFFGAMDLEFDDYIPASSKAKKVIKVIADAVGRIVWLRRMNETQLDDTREAFSELERSYRKGPSPLQRHTVFVANSDRADEQVMKIILRVLDEFSDLFDVNHWKTETSSGSIADQVRAAIAAADFGLCYISEPSREGAMATKKKTSKTKTTRRTKTTKKASKGTTKRTDKAPKYRYLDNPNVLFEAGMLQMLHELRDDRSELVSRWVPVREGPGVAPPLPFDFAGDRVVTVPREGGAGPVEESAFTEMLRKTVQDVIDDLNIA